MYVVCCNDFYCEKVLCGCGYDMQEWVIENGGVFIWCVGDVIVGLIVELCLWLIYFVSDFMNCFEYRFVS